MAERKVKVITTNFKEDIFWKEDIKTAVSDDCMHVVNIYPEFKRQIVKGFGGAFTESSGYNYAKLADEAKQEFVKAYYSAEGLNYQLGRTHINSCDFSLSNYAAVTDENDTEFKTFSLEREQQYILPLIKDAMAVCDGKITFLLSPWSPPAFMKTNSEMNNGGKLKKEYSQAWASYMAKYIKELQKEGMEISYISVQNEPDAVQTWDSCQYSAQEEMEFVRDYLGPTLEKEGLSHIGIFVWDHNKEIAFDRAKAILSDEAAAKYVYGIAVHWYTGDHFESLSLIKEHYPGKEIFFTEGCVEYSRFMDSNETSKAEMYAHDMMGNFNHGMSAFIDWNLLLDAGGGPNHVKNFCAAPIMSTADEKSFEKRLSYYYIGHFSKYVKPGAYVTAWTKYNGDIECGAFVNPDGERVVALLNRHDKDLAVTVRENGIGTELEVKAHSIVTVCF